MHIASLEAHSYNLWKLALMHYINDKFNGKVALLRNTERLNFTSQAEKELQKKKKKKHRGLGTGSSNSLDRRSQS